MSPGPSARNKLGYPPYLASLAWSGKPGTPGTHWETWEAIIQAAKAGSLAKFHVLSMQMQLGRCCRRRQLESTLDFGYLSVQSWQVDSSIAYQRSHWSNGGFLHAGGDDSRLA